MIDFKDVCKSYGGQVLLDRVSFRINPGDRVGVVGPNGSGKSTLFGIITGDVYADRGTVALPKQLRIGYLRQHLPAAEAERSLLDYTADALPELKIIAEKLKKLEHELHERNDLDEAGMTAVLEKHGRLQTEFEHFGGYRIRSEAESALSGLGFHADAFQRPLSSFSGGWQMRAALARVLISQPDILLLDEPSNYLDIPAVEWLDRFLRSFKGTILLISHDRFLLKRLTGITLEVNCGQVSRYPGDYDFYRRERENRIISLEAAKRNQDRKKEQMVRTIERFKSKSSKAAQAQSWMKALDKLEEIVLPDNLNFTGEIKIPAAPPCGIEAARIEDMSFSYNGSDMILRDVNLQIDTGDKLAIVGYNGTGKTTLLKLLAGQLMPKSGQVTLGHNIIRGYQAQEFADILPQEQSVYDVVRNAMPENMPTSSLMAILGSFGFSGDSAHKQCKVLSGGEKIRLCFARIFVNPPNLLILDEPTTHLDIAAREALQEALKNYQGTVCLVSHDIEFVRNAATSIIAMCSPGIRKYFGNYDYYREKSSTEASAVEQNDGEAEISADSIKDRRRDRAKKRQELHDSKKRAEKSVNELERKLEKLEAEQAALLEKMNAGGNIDFEDFNRNLQRIRKEIEEATAAWEVVAEELEEILRLNAEIHS